MATYKSVVLNNKPSDIPQDATLYRVRVDAFYYGEVTHKTADGPKTGEQLQGLRGALLNGDGVEANEQLFEIKIILGSMCNTWLEAWSDDHDVRDGKLYGYIVGRPDGQTGNTIRIWPMLYHTASAPGGWLHERLRHYPDLIAKTYGASEVGEWRTLRQMAEQSSKSSEANRENDQGDEVLQ